MSGVWFLPDQIESDYQRFAAQIQNMYQVGTCSIYKHQEGQKFWFGYLIQLGNNTMIIRMLYSFNHVVELQQSTEGWEVFYNNESFLGSFLTLGDVFDRFGFKSR